MQKISLVRTSSSKVINLQMKTITEAAELAAYFSNIDILPQVPVDLVQVKHIRKPNGAKPGYVIYENQKTVIVTPEEEKIIAMKQNG